MIGLSGSAKIACANLLSRQDIQDRPGIWKALENLLTGRKPVPKVKGAVRTSGLPDGFIKKDQL
jgi:hypothetical protein